MTYVCTFNSAGKRILVTPLLLPHMLALSGSVEEESYRQYLKREAGRLASLVVSQDPGNNSKNNNNSSFALTDVGEREDDWAWTSTPTYQSAGSLTLSV